MENKPIKMYKPTNDYYFKRIFGSQKNKDILIDLLSSILPKLQIKDIDVKQEVSFERQFFEGKLSRLDIVATLDDGTVIDIEMQNQVEPIIVDRSVYYSAVEMVNKLKKKEAYLEIPRCIEIWILGENLFDNGPYHEVAKLRRNYENIILTDKVEYHYIQLTKFKEQYRRISSKLDEWLTFIINENLEEIRMIDNECVKKAEEELDLLNSDEMEREYARKVEEYRVGIALEKGYSFKKGLEEGKKEGKDEEKNEIVKKMKAKGMADELIMELTGFTKEEINKIKS